jgi:hypothetical protein
MRILTVLLYGVPAASILHNSSSFNSSVAQKIVTHITASQSAVTTTTYSRSESKFWGYMQAQKWVEPYCRSKLSSSLSSWDKTMRYSISSTANSTIAPEITRFSESSHIYRMTELVADQGSRVFSYTVSSPCCGYCHVHGRDVNIYFWPSSNHSAGGTNSSVRNISKLVNSNGFTL